MTLKEWERYISTLSGEALRSKAIAANSYRFVQILLSEGLSSEEINTIFQMFANQFLKTEQTPPSDGYVNYQILAFGE
jgi:hypothetical protein